MGEDLLELLEGGRRNVEAALDRVRDLLRDGERYHSIKIAPQVLYLGTFLVVEGERLRVAELLQNRIGI